MKTLQQTSRTSPCSPPGRMVALVLATSPRSWLGRDARSGGVMRVEWPDLSPLRPPGRRTTGHEQGARTYPYNPGRLKA
jgi:hypothetical protein